MGNSIVFRDGAYELNGVLKTNLLSNTELMAASSSTSEQVSVTFVSSGVTNGGVSLADTTSFTTGELFAFSGTAPLAGTTNCYEISIATRLLGK